MLLILRRGLVAAGATLAAGLIARKPRAEPLRDLATALKPAHPPVPPPDITFLTTDGKVHHLTEFAGHGMVVNLWATWCAPCVAELPSLAALSKAVAPQDIAVLPLSSDRGGAPAVATFYHAHGIAALPVLLDPGGEAERAVHARGIPTSLVIDRKGRECARLEGAADWSSEAAANLVRKLVAG